MSGASRDRPASSVSSVKGVGTKAPRPIDTRVVQAGVGFTSSDTRGLTSVPYALCTSTRALADTEARGPRLIWSCANTADERVAAVGDRDRRLGEGGLAPPRSTTGPEPRRWPLCEKDPRTLNTRVPASQRATTPASARVVSADCTNGCPSGATAPASVPP